MKKLQYILACAAGLCLAAPAFGQSYANGYLMTRSYFNVSDMTTLSTVNNGYGTARSVAMGGAMTALGGDLSALGINPAGLGMYRSSEVTLSPSFNISKYSNSSPFAPKAGDNSKNHFGIDNAGLALNLYQGAGALTSVTFGFGYNKLADYNYRSGAATAVDNLSIGEVFVNQLRGYEKDDLSDSRNPWRNSNIPVSHWGAVLAYKSALLDPQENSSTSYYLPHFGQDTPKTHFAQVNSKGRLEEYSVGMGFNFSNRVYLGFGIGIRNLYHKQEIHYLETYDFSGGAGTIADPYDYMIYNQWVKMTGSAVNLKFGVLVNPVAGLRLGVAVHTPSWVSLKKEYDAYMYARPLYPVDRYDYGEANTNLHHYDYDFSTPTRLMFGASYAFGSKAIITADYERMWYNGMRLNPAREDRYYYDDNNIMYDVKKEYRDEIKNDYKASNILRLGAEIKPTQQFAVRAGYAFMGSFLQDTKAVFDSPIGYQTYNLSAGLGYRFANNMSLDLSYVYSNTKFTEWDLYYYYGQTNDGSIDEIMSEFGIASKQNRHNITLSLGVRF